MRLALLGGSGRTGRLLIDGALVRGHTLNVLARRPESLHRAAEVTVVPGDARDPAALDALLQGTQAILSALGPVRGGPPDVMTVAAWHLVRLMPAHGLRRVVTLTGAGVDQPGDHPKAVDRVFRTLLRLTQPQVIADAAGHCAALRASGLDWTIVRVPMLTDGPAGPLRVGLVGDIGVRVSRASVAGFMLDTLDDSALVGQAPAISGAALSGRS